MSTLLRRPEVAGMDADVPVSHGRCRAWALPGRAAFTMIELLVVITVIALLIAAIALVAHRVLYSQKVKYTETIMRSVTMAIEQFANEDPLRNVYDRKDKQTFGPYPPYQLDNRTGAPSVPPGKVCEVLEFYDSDYGAPGTGRPYDLADRIWRDVGQGKGGRGDWACDALATPDDDDDIRALYTYLRVYGSGVLAQVPGDRVTQIKGQTTPYFVNPTGKGTVAGASGLIDVLGIHDAWGVPLNYYLYAKLEYGVTASGSAQWRVTDRMPVVFSWGVTAEEYVAEQGGTDALDPDKWIFSAPFPQPGMSSAGLLDPKTGVLVVTPPASGSGNGWVRVRAANETAYDYGP